MLKSTPPKKKDFVGPAVIEASDCTKSFAIGSVIIKQRVLRNANLSWQSNSLTQKILTTFVIFHFHFYFQVPTVGNLTKNLNLWETKQIEKTHAKKNKHMYKIIFMWFSNLSTSTELQRFHYKIRKYNSALEHPQETQISITL